MLKIAVFSDIHSNYLALQKCLDYAVDKGIDTFLFLGDYLGELAYPQRTMELLYSMRDRFRCVFIKGNKEDYWLNHKDGSRLWQEYDSTTGCLYYAYQNISERDLHFFNSLPITRELVFDDMPPITICHGSPRDVKEKLIPDDENTFDIMRSQSSDYILCGHTHIQGKILHGGKTVLNPGSVGLPHRSGGKAQFMILTGMPGRWDCEFISLEYDVEKVIEELRLSGLSEKAPWWCRVSANALRTGEASHYQVLIRAMELCKKQSGECSWPNIPEECWEQAVKELLPPFLTSSPRYDKYNPENPAPL